MKYRSFLSFIPFFIVLIGCEKGVVDEFDCTESDLSLNIGSIQQVSCGEGGVVVFDVSGGLGQVQLSIDGSTFVNETTFSDLAAGSYSGIARDENGCEISVQFDIGTEPSSIKINTIVQETTCGVNEGSVEVTATGGIGNYEYKLGDGMYGETNSFDALGQGNYTVSVRDEEGCETKETFKVTTGTSLENEIMPIIEANCALTTCHGSIQSPRFTTKEVVIENAQIIKTRTQEGTMPPASRDPLTQDEINKIACWVDDGAKNN